ncbi:tRNA modification GTPase [Moryella indoligenes]|uniref:tRNA modification GTPase MnmE n=1 Tax=Moryella indoligenes TaxID=371674 RepID=A0AAE3V9K0_9FIRM|nr:tRNA uridine-5-carboxymethylaminomethyl(34) synthesis GTPase MnmE [Moryella indoligenes]MDQ0152266.1 tRNA modification GTPase [Moryella indoligenes]
MRHQRENDTIAAISTALGESGIGIIRISGTDAVDIASRVLDRGVRKAETHTIHYRHAVCKNEIIDEVLVSVMLAPRSYTGENTVEINCHGGVLAVERVLEEVLKAGASLAEPGEFSKRAFLNGRIDLSQAEAVMDVIQAKNRFALKAAVSQLSGTLSKKLKELRNQLLDETAWIEAALDDPEHYDLSGYPEELGKKTDAMIADLETLIRNAENGRVMKEGISTVILGRPNAGKSSLMNLLSGADRAIVTDIAGTTRDILTEHIRLAGLSLNLTDTAGIRESEDIVERIGVERARKAAEEADLLLLVIDGSSELQEADRLLLHEIEEKNAIVLLNKSDLDTQISLEELQKLSSHPVILFSAKDGTGLSEMETTMREMFYHGNINFNDQIYITNSRHREALEQALASVRLVKQSIKNGLPEDFFSIDLQDAYESLGIITGETVEDDVVNRIFEKFCTGK